MSRDYYIGLMTGTSIDGLDGCLIATDGKSMEVFANQSRSYPAELRTALHSLCSSSPDEIERAGRTRVALANEEAALVGELLAKAGLNSSEITAIGSHGQTIRHRPREHFTIQLEDGARLAYLTGIDTITDFRSFDVAAGGEGAPLTPLFHELILKSPTQDRLVLNLGGIANLTLLRHDAPVGAGFDTGPANTLLDLTCRELVGKPYDEDAQIASSGHVNREWLATLMQHPYLEREPPKSTGRETFNRELIAPYLEYCKLNPDLTPDLLATLTEYTALTVVNAIRALLYREHIASATLIICGGGTFNPLLRERLTTLSRACNVTLRRAADFGIGEQYLEAQAFAYFACCFVQGRPLPLSPITGAKAYGLGGCLYPAPDGAYRRHLSSGL